MAGTVRLGVGLRYHDLSRVGLATNVTLQDLGNVGEFLAAVATVGSLVYLAIQIRANTNAVRTAAAQSVHEAFAAWHRLLAADASLSQLVANGLRDYSALNETDKARFIATFMAFLSYCQDAFIKWREGSLAPELWSGWELVMMNLVNAPGGKEFWAERGYLFGDTFRHHVENDIMKRKPHPRAKPMGPLPSAAIRDGGRSRRADVVNAAGSTGPSIRTPRSQPRNGRHRRRRAAALHDGRRMPSHPVT